jgi:hypothetical protein
MAIGFLNALLIAAAAGGVLLILLSSIYSIGPKQVGLVRKRFGSKLPGDSPVAFEGKAGYQADMLMPGLRFKLCLVYAVTKHPWVQVPAGQIGVVISQVGEALPIGAKSAVYKTEFGNFATLRVFMEKGGQKGVQRPVLSPGTVAPIHPVAFLVITRSDVFGVPFSSDLGVGHTMGRLTHEAFGPERKQMEVTRISPRPTEGGRVVDMVGVVTTSKAGLCRRATSPAASRLRGYRSAGSRGCEESAIALIETILGTRIIAQRVPGLPDVSGPGRNRVAHDPLLYGAYNLNPFLVREEVPMLVIEQAGGRDQSLRGLLTQDTRRRVQIRKPGAPGTSGHLAGSSADRKISDQPAVLSGGDRAHVHHHAELGGCRFAGA